MSRTNTFLKLYAAYYEWVRYDFAQADPRVLIALLSLGDAGISQTQLSQELDVKQSQLSKLLTKLVRLEVLSEEPSPIDGRVRLYRSTPAAGKVLASLESALQTEI